MLILKISIAFREKIHISCTCRLKLNNVFLFSLLHLYSKKLHFQNQNKNTKNILYFRIYLKNKRFIYFITVVIFIWERETVKNIKKAFSYKILKNSKRNRFLRALLDLCKFDINRLPQLCNNNNNSSVH